MLQSCFLLILGFFIADGHYDPDQPVEQTTPQHESRRILKGKEIFDTRPYMVFLRAAKPQLDKNWLCGGVIIGPRYILTSAACIEDVQNFYVISGTHGWIPQSATNECIKNGATKAIWKCVPKVYRFDGHSYNNIRWMANDIAIVMTADAFNFKKRVKGCDFIPQMIAFNNESLELEAAGRQAAIAGWGSTEEYTDPADTQPIGFDLNEHQDQPTAVDVPKKPEMLLPEMLQPEKQKPQTKPEPSKEQYNPFPDNNPTTPEPQQKLPVEITRAGSNSPQLMEADVEIIEKNACKSLWHERYHGIIDEHMICGKNIELDDVHDDCAENEMECREMAFSNEDGGTLRRHHTKNFDNRLLRSLRRVKSLRRARQKSLRREGKEVGGFCENDHGGPLITGKGRQSVVIGIMSAYRTIKNSRLCVGPFLYTSIYKNRHLINCALQRQSGNKYTCRTVLRESSTVLDQEKLHWSNAGGSQAKQKKKSKHSKSKTKKLSSHLKNVKLVNFMKAVEANGTINTIKGDVTKENVAFLSGHGPVPYNKIRRHVPLKKRRANDKDTLNTTKDAISNENVAFLAGSGAQMPYNKRRRIRPLNERSLPRTKRLRAHANRRSAAQTAGTSHM